MTSFEKSATPPPAEGLSIGEVVGPFGTAGEVKLYPLTDFPERLPRYRRLVLELADGSRREFRVQRARPHKNIWLLKLRDVNTPEAAEALRGARVILPSELVQPLPEGHFYLRDVIGLRVVTPEGEELGIVTEVLRSPANDVYVAGSLMIPAVKEMIERIDPAAGVLVVRSKEAVLGEEVAPAPELSETRRSPAGAGTRDTERERRRLSIKKRSAANGTPSNRDQRRPPTAS